MTKHGCSRDIKGERLDKYSLFTKASYRNLWCVRVLLDAAIDSAVYVPNHCRENTFLLIQKLPDRLCGSSSLLFTATGDLSRGLNGQGVKLTIHLHLVQRLTLIVLMWRIG